MSLPPGSCSTCHSGAQCAGVRSCHCGMDMCGNLSLVSQHMCGWPCSGYYCCLGAIDSNPLSLLVWTLIMLPPIASRLSFTRNDLHNWCSTFWICWNWRCISLTARIKLPPGGPEKPPSVNPPVKHRTKELLLARGCAGQLRSFYDTRSWCICFIIWLTDTKAAGKHTLTFTWCHLSTELKERLTYLL